MFHVGPCKQTSVPNVTVPSATSRFRMLPLRPSVKVFWVPAVCPEDAEGKHMCVTWRVPDMSTGRSRSALGA